MINNARGSSPAGRGKKMDMQKVHEVYEMLFSMGATKEDIIKIFEIGFKTADKVIDETLEKRKFDRA